jgi:adenosine deaminase
VKELKTHPIRELFERGLLVSVNTDDPAMFNTSLADEYLMLMSELGFELDEVRSLVANAIESSWADDGTKKRLHDELVASGTQRSRE